MNNTTRITRVTRLLSAGLLMAEFGLTVTAGALPARAAASPRPAQFQKLGSSGADATSGIEFKLSEAGGIYTVYMRPNAAPTDPNATSSAQVTIKAPHGVFAPSEITSLVPGTVWQTTSRQDTPAEAAGSDYVSFSLDFPNGDVKAFNWGVNTEQAVFTFKAASGAHLMDTCDAFAVPNSRSASVGNEIAVVGFGNVGKSAYVGNYDQTQDCPTATQAVSAVSLGAESSVKTVTSGSLITYTFKIKNGGLRTAQSLSLKIALTGVAEVRSVSNSFEAANPLLEAGTPATWQLGELAPGAEGTVTVVAVALARENDTLVAAATVAATNDDSKPDNDAKVTVGVSMPVSGIRIHLPLIMR